MEIAHTVKIFFEIHPELIYMVTGVGMFFSALFPVSFVFYGDYIFIPAALLAQGGFADIRFVYLCTVLGVYTGDCVSFVLGYKLKRSIFTKDAKYLNISLLEK